MSSSSLESGSHLLLEPTVTMHEEPGEVFLSSEPPPTGGRMPSSSSSSSSSLYSNGELPAQISITRISSPPGTPGPLGTPQSNSKTLNSAMSHSFKASPRSDLAGIVPRGLRPVQIRPPPLIRGGAPGIPPPPRLQFAGIPSNIRPVNRGVSHSTSNPILGMMNVAKKVGNHNSPPSFSSRGNRGPSPRCKQQPHVNRSPMGAFPIGVPGIKNVSPMMNPCRPPPPMMRPGYRPVTVRMRGRPPLIKKEAARIIPLKVEPKIEKVSPTKEDHETRNAVAPQDNDPPPRSPAAAAAVISPPPVLETTTESSPPALVKVEKSPQKAESSSSVSETSKRKSLQPEDHNGKELSDDPEISFSPHPPSSTKKKMRLSNSNIKNNPLNEEKAADQDEDKGATKFRFVRRADGKGFVKKSVKSCGGGSSPMAQAAAVRKAYSATAVLKGIRKKKKKPFKGINYRFDGSIKRKKKNFFSYNAKDDDDNSSIRSDQDLSTDHDVLTYLGIQRKDSTDSIKSSNNNLPVEGTKDKSVTISGPKARKSFGNAGNSQKRPLEDPSVNDGIRKKTRTYTSPKVGQFFPLPSFPPPVCSSNVPLSSPLRPSASLASTSVSASEEEPSKDDEDEEDDDEDELDPACKVSENLMPGDGGDGESGDGSNINTNTEKRVTRALRGTLDPNFQAVNYICECEKSGDEPLNRRNGSLLCRAVESVGGSRVGCKNNVQSLNQLRPDLQLPKKVFCEVHVERLRAHQACGFCGEFCSHGRFFLCRPNKRFAPHLFHQSCYNRAKVQACCHCGSTKSPAVVILSLKMDRTPLQLLRTVSKMSFSAGKKTKTSEAEELTSEEELKYKMPNGKVISSHRLPMGLGNAVLQRVLNELEDKAAPKHLTRNMYFPTKSGDSVKILQLLGQGYSPNQKFLEYKNGSPLHLSAAEGHVLNCHIFTQSGSELDSFDDAGNTPIHLASIKGRTEVVRYLLQAGADMALRGEDGMTCLHFAAQNGHLDTVKIILAHHNLPRNFLNLQDDGGWTPLVWACENKHEKIIKHLLLRGSNPLIVDAEGNIALHWSSLSGSKTTCEVLMDYGCDVNARNTNGDAPIHIALRQDHYECAVLLLMRGAITNVKNKNGQLPVDCLTKDAKSATIMKLSTKLNAMMTDNKAHVHERIVTNDVSKGKENCPIQCINAVDKEGAPKDYVYVRNNVVTSAIPIDRNHASLQHCKCEDVCSSEESCNCSKLSVKSWYDLEGKLKSSFDYKEPPMIFECNDLCNCNVATCHNRVIQHGVTSRMIVFRTESMGWGVRALKDIAKGTFVCEYVGEIISDSEADTREDSYLFDLDYREGETFCIDANRFGNIARFINHSCNPNLTPVKVFAEHQDLRFPHIALFANRDIPKGTELGFDYGEKFWVIKHRTFTCHCGSEICHYNQTTINAFLKDYYQRFPVEHPDFIEKPSEVGIKMEQPTGAGVDDERRRSSSETVLVNGMNAEVASNGVRPSRRPTASPVPKASS